MTQHVGVSGGARHEAAGTRLWRGLVGLTGYHQLLLGIGIEIL